MAFRRPRPSTTEGREGRRGRNIPVETVTILLGEGGRKSTRPGRPARDDPSLRPSERLATIIVQRRTGQTRSDAGRDRPPWRTLDARCSPIMPEHRIRLREGWESSALDGHPGDVGRLSLPVVWTRGTQGPIRLSRRFGRPPIDPAIESIRLELRGIPGLRSVHLNGVALGPPPAGVLDWTLPLTEPLGSRNTLTLEVVLEQASTVEIPEGWGSIALMIAPKSGPGV